MSGPGEVQLIVYSLLKGGMGSTCFAPTFFARTLISSVGAASSDVPEASAAGSGLQAVRTSQAAGSTPLETGEPRSVAAQAPTVLDRATPTGLTQAIAPYLEGASVEVLATCFAEKWSREQRQRLLVLVEQRAAAARAEADAESTAAGGARAAANSGCSGGMAGQAMRGRGG